MSHPGQTPPMPYPWEHRAAARRPTAVAGPRKHCWICGDWLTLSSFGRDRYRADGHNNACRPCRALYTADRTKGRFALAPTLDTSYDSVVGISGTNPVTMASEPTVADSSGGLAALLEGISSNE